jgi:hypothetical protein
MHLVVEPLLPSARVLVLLTATPVMPPARAVWQVQQAENFLHLPQALLSRSIKVHADAACHVHLLWSSLLQMVEVVL